MNNRRITQILLVYIVFLSTIISCSDGMEVTPREYPRVKTLGVTDISEEGVQFNAEIIYPGNEAITEYGFVWSEGKNPVIGSANQKKLSDNIITGTFKSRIESGLKAETDYHVRAYVINNSYTVYGKNISFFSLGSKEQTSEDIIDYFTETTPEISSIMPTVLHEGDTLLIKGKGFTSNSTNSELFVKLRNALYDGGVGFAGANANIIQFNDSIISAKIPVLPLHISMQYLVSVIKNDLESNQIELFVIE